MANSQAPKKKPVPSSGNAGTVTAGSTTVAQSTPVGKIIVEKVKSGMDVVEKNTSKGTKARK